MLSDVEHATNRLKDISMTIPTIVIYEWIAKHQKNIFYGLEKQDSQRIFFIYKHRL